jgi:hypothetical protein
MLKRLFALIAVGGLWFSPAAQAASTKTCTTTTANAPSNGWQTQTTNTQTSSCNSSSDTGFTPVSSTTQNPGGKLPPAKQ